MKTNAEIFKEKEFEIESLLTDELLLIKEKHCRNKRFNIEWSSIIANSLGIIYNLLGIGMVAYSVWITKKNKAVQDLQDENKAIKLNADEAEEIIQKVCELLNIPYPPVSPA